MMRYFGSLPNHEAGGPPLVSSLQQLIQYSCTYPPYLEAVSSIIRDSRMCHTMMTGTHITWDKLQELLSLHHIRILLIKQLKSGLQPQVWMW